MASIMRKNTIKKKEKKNKMVGFSCLKYSVIENEGFVKISIVKKKMKDSFVIGVRT